MEYCTGRTGKRMQIINNKINPWIHNPEMGWSQSNRENEDKWWIKDGKKLTSKLKNESIPKFTGNVKHIALTLNKETAVSWIFCI